jgi:hypothetical protein
VDTKLNARQTEGGYSQMAQAFPEALLAMLSLSIICEVMPRLAK